MLPAHLCPFYVDSLHPQSQHSTHSFPPSPIAIPTIPNLFITSSTLVSHSRLFQTDRPCTAWAQLSNSDPIHRFVACIQQSSGIARLTLPLAERDRRAKRSTPPSSPFTVRFWRPGTATTAIHTSPAVLQHAGDQSDPQGLLGRRTASPAQRTITAEAPRSNRRTWKGRCRYRER